MTKKAAATVKIQVGSPAPEPELQTIPVSELKFAPYNPRKIDPKELAKLENSIKEYGVVEFIVWNKQTKHVVGGNQRLKALRNLGIESTKCIIVDLSLEKEMALNLALNRISGDWEYELLKDVIAKLDEEDKILTGFDEAELQALSEGIIDIPLNVVDVDQEPKPVTMPGDDGVSFVVYLSFSTIEKANEFLLNQLGQDEIKPGKRTKVVDMG